VTPHTRGAVSRAAGDHNRPRTLTDVTDAAYCVQEFFREGIVDLAAQPTHGDLHDVRIAVEVHVPHLLGKRRARQHLPVPTQQRQQREFLRGQIESLSGTRGFVPNQIELEIGETEDGGIWTDPRNRTMP